MIEPAILEGRRRVVAILDELTGAGLLTYALTPHEIDDAEPRLDVWSDMEKINRSAWGLVSRDAAWIWDLLREGRLRIGSPSIRAIQNVLEGARL